MVFFNKRAACAVLLLSNIARAEDGPCIDLKDGLPLSTYDKNLDKYNVTCHIKDKYPSEDESIEHVDVDADLIFKTYPISADGINGLTKIKISEQSANLTFKFKGNIARIVSKADVSVKFAPTMEFSGDSLCTMKLDNFSINITAINSTLPSLVNIYLKNYLNKGAGLNKPVKEKVNKAIAEYTASACQQKTEVSETRDDIKLSDDVAGKLNDQQNLYFNLASDLVDSHGWLNDTHCDGLLYAGITNWVGFNTDVGSAQAEPGRWHRHWEKDCYENSLRRINHAKSSASEISRDMFTGLLQWLVKDRRIQEVNDIISYGKAHALEGIPFIWVMGQGQFGRVELRPSLIQTLFDIREYLSGEISPYKGMDLQAWGDCLGYECHLFALHLKVINEIGGYISPQGFSKLKEMADNKPNNALLNVLYGKLKHSKLHIDRATNVLLNEALFPTDRLPTSNDRCADYLWSKENVKPDLSGQMQTSSDWLPCSSEGKMFSGLDFIFVSSLLLDKKPIY